MKPVRIVLLVAALLGAAFVAGFFYVVNDDESAIIAGGALFYGRLSDGKVDEVEVVNAFARYFTVPE